MIGGGPAGLFLAARAAALSPALRDAGILLVEKMPKPGRKLLASGSGHCNITHQGAMGEFLGRYGDKGRFLKRALYAFGNDELAAWLGERGLDLEAEEGGKLFPSSRKASDVLDLLLRECSARGVSMRTGVRATAIHREAGGFFSVELVGPEGEIATCLAPLLAIATGGASYPGTGSTGDGYALAAALGHAIVRPRPALAPARVDDAELCALTGLSFADLGFALRRGGRIIGRFRGDVLVTHEGLSGPGILDASRVLEPGDTLELDFTGIGLDAYRARLAARIADSPRALVRSLVAGLPRRLAELLCSRAGLGPEARCADLKREARESLARLATEFPARVAALGGFDVAMATGGGVSLDEVAPATMASRIVDGLYFAGEVLDYDGDTGGFNLQAAFSTADAAARAMAAR